MRLGQGGNLTSYVSSISIQVHEYGYNDFHIKCLALSTDEFIFCVQKLSSHIH